MHHCIFFRNKNKQTHANPRQGQNRFDKIYDTRSAWKWGSRFVWPEVYFSPRRFAPVGWTEKINLWHPGYKLWDEGCWMLIKSERYLGDRPCKTLKVIKSILQCILGRTGNQCSSASRGVMWQNLYARYITLALAFITRCNLLVW